MVIINLGAIYYFIPIKDSITNYRELQHRFETSLGEEFKAYSYDNVILRLQLSNGTVNTLRISNISWAPNLGHNLFSTISLAKERIEVFLREISQLFKIFIKDKLVRLADMIDN